MVPPVDVSLKIEPLSHCLCCTIMSVFSSDTDPDMEDERCRFQPLPEPVSPLSTSASMRVVEWPLHYQALPVPVVSSAVSSAWVSPGRQGGEFCAA